MILAHAATVNRLVALAVASVIAGEPAPYSNRLAACEPLLRGLVTATGSLPEMRAEVLRTGRLLIELAAELGRAAGTPVLTHIAEGEIVHVDGPVPAMALIASTLGYHLSVHAEQLAALHAGGSAAEDAEPSRPAAA
jgi:hypothetical protein